MVDVAPGKQIPVSLPHRAEQRMLSAETVGRCSNEPLHRLHERGTVTLEPGSRSSEEGRVTRCVARQRGGEAKHEPAHGSETEGSTTRSSRLSKLTERNAERIGEMGKHGPHIERSPAARSGCRKVLKPFRKCATIFGVAEATRHGRRDYAAKLRQSAQRTLERGHPAAHRHGRQG